MRIFSQNNFILQQKNQQINKQENLKDFKPSFSGHKSDTFVKKGLQKKGLIATLATAVGSLISITAFSKKHKIDIDSLRKGIEENKVETTANKKIVEESPITQKFLENYKLSKAKDIRKLNKASFGKLVNIGIHSVDWHIKKGRIVLNEDGTIDATNPINKHFIANFSKMKNKDILIYSPEKYNHLQRILGNITIEYCLQNGHLIADENGNINMLEDKNKDFIEQVKNKEISYRTFFPTKQQFADILEISTSTVERAILKGEILYDASIGIDMSNPKNIEYRKKIEEKRHSNPNQITMTEFAKRLGYSDYQGVSYHLKAGRLVREENGLFDITKEENKHFIEEHQKGRRSSISPVRFIKTQRNVQQKGSCVSQSTFSRMLGITQPTLYWHILKGHVVKSELGIDLNDPKNKAFVDNFKNGFPLSESNEENNIVNDNEIRVSVKKVNANELSFSEFALMTQINKSTLQYYVEKGWVERNDDGKIDLNNAKNKKFVSDIDKKTKTKFYNLNFIETDKAINEFQKLLILKTSKSVFDIGKSILEISDNEFNHYIKFVMQSIINTDDLTPKQEKKLLEIYKSAILKEIESPNRSKNLEYSKTTNKMELHGFKHLINATIQRKFNLAEIKSTNIPNQNKTNSRQKDASMILNDYINTVKKNYEKEISLLKKAKNVPTKELTNNYLFNRYMVALHTNRLQTTTLSLRYLHNIEDLQKDKAKIIIEKILKDSDMRTSSNTDFEKWKKQLVFSTVEKYIKQALKIYEEDLLDNICTDTALKMLQQTDKENTLTRENLVEYIKKELDL